MVIEFYFMNNYRNPIKKKDKPKKKVSVNEWFITINDIHFHGIKNEL